MSDIPDVVLPLSSARCCKNATSGAFKAAAGAH